MCCAHLVYIICLVCINNQWALCLVCEIDMEKPTHFPNAFRCGMSYHVRLGYAVFILDVERSEKQILYVSVFQVFFFCLFFFFHWTKKMSESLFNSQNLGEHWFCVEWVLNFILHTPAPWAYLGAVILDAEKTRLTQKNLFFFLFQSLTWSPLVFIHSDSVSVKHIIQDERLLGPSSLSTVVQLCFENRLFLAETLFKCS